MDAKKKKTLIIAGISVLVATGIAIGVGIAVNRYVQRKKESEMEILLKIARNEGSMSEADYKNYRTLLFLDDYQLPASLQNAFNKMRPYLVSAGAKMQANQITEGLKDLAKAKSLAPSDPMLKSQYNTVESLLVEAFKLNAPNTNIQEKINSAKEKSAGFWPSLLYLHPIGAIYNVASGYSEHQWRDARQWVERNVNDNVQKNLNFNKKLMGLDMNTKKLYSEAFKAISGGKDYFKTQKDNLK